MGITWYPDGWEIDVPNPGYGEVWVRADARPFSGAALVDKDWFAQLTGTEVGEWLTQLTNRALDLLPPTKGVLPTFITQAVARGLLPAFQKAALYAVAGSDRYERVLPDDGEPPERPLCATCNEGTWYTPGALPSDWCAQHGHTPFGYPAGTSWDRAQRQYQTRRARWDERNAQRA